MDYIAEAKSLIRNLGQRMGPSAYDIAWMVRLKDDDGGPRWPDLVDWLLNNQYEDGSWGGQIVYYHDRIICTLSAAIALSEYRDILGVERSIQRAEKYIWNHLHLLTRDPFEMVGFELIVPTLMEEARALGLDVPTHTCGYGEVQTAKLRLIPLEKLYSPNISTVYSLEFLGQSGDPEKLGAALAANGSLGNSPATTAYYLSLCNQEDQRALDYLETVRSHMKHVIPVYPFRIFELTWVLYNLSFSGIPVTHFVDEEIWIELQSELGPFGVGSDSTFIPDGDTTSVTCRLLSEAGYEVDPAILKYYEDQTRGIFRTYSYERNISISTNVHVLDALDFIENYPNRNNLKEQIIVMLLDNRKYNMYWTDKWHASPYYTTSHALMTMLKEGGSYLAHACQHTIEWLLHTQRSDGSWGFFERGTPEETAYVLMTLVHYDSYVNVGREAIHKGAAYLMQTYESFIENSPPLWIVKCLFFPHEIVRSAVLTALILYEQVLK